MMAGEVRVRPIHIVVLGWLAVACVGSLAGIAAAKTAGHWGDRQQEGPNGQVAVAATGATPGHTTTTHMVAPAIPGTQTGTATPTCRPDWYVVTGPGADWSFLKGIAAPSPSDIWAVGYYGPDRHALIEHWDGERWQVVASPTPANGTSELVDVAVLSENDVWAVGDYVDFAGHGFLLTEHWNGSQWEAAIAPTIGATPAALVVASDDIWVVGGSHIAHWNGSQWSQVPSPAPATSALNGIAAVAPDDVWAVGFYSSNCLGYPLVLHWDGGQWNMVPAPSAGQTTRLFAVKAISANDVWAVGFHALRAAERNPVQHRLLGRATRFNFL